jgi:hypothetical protein
MRLNFLTLVLVIGISSPVLSMEDPYDADDELGSRKERGRLRYQNKLKRKIGELKEEGFIEVKPQPKLAEKMSLPGDELPPKKSRKLKKSLPPESPLTLKVAPVDLPKSISRSGRTIDVIGDPLKITIALADGKPYQCGSRGTKIDISGFEPMGNRSINGFNVHIQDVIRHLNREAQTLIHTNHRKQSMRGKFTYSSSVTDPTVHVEYDKGARKFFAYGLWPDDRRSE